MKKASFSIISMALVLVFIPAVSQASLSENFSQLNRKTGIPTDPLIVQSSMPHPEGVSQRNVLAQCNLYEGRVEISRPVVSGRIVAPEAQTMLPGNSSVSGSDGTQTMYPNAMLNELPPRNELYNVTVVVSEGWVKLRTAYGETKLEATTSDMDFNSLNVAQITYGPLTPTNHPEISAFQQLGNPNATTLTQVVQSQDIGTEMTEANSVRGQQASLEDTNTVKT